MRPLKSLAVIAAALIGTAAAACVARAQADYPNKPIRLIVGFPPGSSADIAARVVGGHMTKLLGQQVVVESKPGAGSSIAAEQVARAEKDGYTLFMLSAANVINEQINPKLTFNIARDFAPVAMVNTTAILLAVNPSIGVNDVKGLIALAKSKPGALNYGSTGIGNPLHLTMEMIKHATGTDILAVPFRGDAQINAALIAGDVEIAVVPLATAVPLIQDGRIRGLAITGAQRSSTGPDIPTVAESGVPGFASNSWQGWFMAAKTPAPIVERIQQETAKALALPDVRPRLAAMAYEGVGQPPAEFAAYYKDEIAKFTKVIADAKIPKQ